MTKNNLIFLAVAIVFSFACGLFINLPISVDLNYIPLVFIGGLAILFFTPPLTLCWMRASKGVDVKNLHKLIRTLCYIMVALTLALPLIVLGIDMFYALQTHYIWENLKNNFYYAPFFVVAWLFYKAGKFRK